MNNTNIIELREKILKGIENKKAMVNWFFQKMGKLYL
jgi:hypothetical protein